MTKPTVSVLLLTWNSRRLVGEALASVWAQTREPDEVIVVDNASSDGTPEQVEAIAGGRARLVVMTRNHGYSGGFNRGLRLAGGDFLLLLNPDVRLDPDFIEQALRGFEDPRVGIVAGLLLRPDRRTVDSSGLFLARSRKTVDRGFSVPFDPARDQAGPVLSACGAAPFYRREMIEDIADGQEFFDESYFAFREDLEVGWRAWRAGWKAVCRPEAVAVHLRSGGAGRGKLGLAFTRSPE
ncbi:MAG: glycosyltransferase family 2 protein [Acidobacteriota bacterium]|nr:glycosyltransferase family 2 protein [Acidobacteriota bacterium]